MYILIFARGYPSITNGYNGVFEYDQAKALNKSKCKVVFACFNFGSIAMLKKCGVDHFIKDGIEIYSMNIPFANPPHRLMYYIGRLLINMFYKRIEKDHGIPDVIHAHFFSIGEIVIHLKKNVDTKFVLTEHSSSLLKDKKKMPNWLVKYAPLTYKSYNRIITVSPHLAKKINDNFGIETSCVPNIYDESIFKISSNNHKNNVFRFVFVGNLIKNKNPVFCIKAFYKAFSRNNFLTKKREKICLSLVGDGPERAECQKVLNEYNLEDNIELTGKISREEIASIMNESRCFVLPSKSETFGVSYIEAMACGLPVIATNCGGPESFVDNTNGCLIPIDDEEALISSFKYMLVSINNFNNYRISCNIFKKYSSERVAERIIQIYEEIIN